MIRWAAICTCYIVSILGDEGAQSAESYSSQDVEWYAWTSVWDASWLRCLLRIANFLSVQKEDLMTFAMCTHTKVKDNTPLPDTKLRVDIFSAKYVEVEAQLQGKSGILILFGYIKGWRFITPSSEVTWPLLPHYHKVPDFVHPNPHWPPSGNNDSSLGTRVHIFIPVSCITGMGCIRKVVQWCIRAGKGLTLWNSYM